MEEEIPLNIKTTSADQGTPVKGTWAEERGKGWKQTPPQMKQKSRWKTGRHTHTQTWKNTHMHTQNIYTYHDIRLD
jgi:hypothetical protein